MKRNRRRVIVVASLSVVLGAAAVSALAVGQAAVRFPTPATPGGHEHSPHSHTLRVKISGKTHPELIPDAIAYHHLIMATAASDTEPGKYQRFRKSVLKRIGFSEADERLYENALDSLRVREELERITRERIALSTAARRRDPAAGKALNQLLIEERALLRRAKAEVLTSISPEGAVTLDRYVQETTKRQISILSGSHPHADED